MSNPYWYKVNDYTSESVLCNGCRTHYTKSYGGPCPKCKNIVCNICKNYGCDRCKEK